MDVEIDGRKVRLAVVRDGEGVWVGWEGRSRYFGPERAGAAGTGRVEREIRAPMSGRVVKVPAAPGASIRAGELLVILEAMKMEYRMSAPRDGVVESVVCKEGERVDLGQVLVTLAP